MRLIFPIGELKSDLKLSKISENLEKVKFIAIVEISDLGLVTDIALLEVGGEVELLPEIIMELEPDIFVSYEVSNIVEVLVGNGTKVALTSSDTLYGAFRDLLLGRARVLPKGEVSLKFAN
ncbi:MAG: hypothetical protein LM591_04865 [Candidatus Korarchaeum sp.]|jgi:hypothetical protein|nr:hypothetical protein [Candidatus Korarchaeum sp.]